MGLRLVTLHRSWVRPGTCALRQLCIFRRCPARGTIYATRGLPCWYRAHGNHQGTHQGSAQYASEPEGPSDQNLLSTPSSRNRNGSLGVPGPRSRGGTGRPSYSHPPPPTPSPPCPCCCCGREAGTGGGGSVSSMRASASYAALHMDQDALKRRELVTRMH